MSFLTILGNAVVDANFRRQLLGSDPVSTVLSYGFQITNDEATSLRLLVADPKLRQDLEGNLEAADQTLIAMRICPSQPCPWSVYSSQGGARTGKAAD